MKKIFLYRLIFLLEDTLDYLNLKASGGLQYPMIGFSFDTVEDAEEFENDVYQAGLPKKSRYKIIGNFDYY